MVYNRYRLINPLLGVYYAIFASIYIGLFILLLITGAVGWFPVSDIWILSGATIGLGGLIALATLSSTGEDFYVAGRRVPAGFSGLVLFSNSLGAVGLVGFVGLNFFMGLDALAIGLGFVAAFYVTAIYIAPFIRKCGAYTLPSFLAIRFASFPIRVISALLLIPACFVFIIAEVSLFSKLGGTLLGDYKSLGAFIMVGVAALCAVTGGLRSLTWTQCAWSIVILIGVLLPLFIIAVNVTNIPLPHLTFGSLIKDIAQFETARGLTQTVPPVATSGLTGGVSQSLSHHFTGLFSSLGRVDFVALIMLVALGLAMRPSVVTRYGASPTVFNARKASSWGVIICGLFVLSAIAYVVFIRYQLYHPKNAWFGETLPSLIKAMSAGGIIQFEDLNNNQAMDVSELRLNRDGIFFLLTILPRYSESVIALTFAAVAAAMASSMAGSLLSIGTMVGVDLSGSRQVYQPAISSKQSILISRFAIVIVAGMALWLGLSSSFDPLSLFLAGLIYLGVSFFPTIVLSIWWRGMSRFGAIASLLFGGVTSLTVLLFYGRFFAEETIYLGPLSFYIACLVGGTLVGVICSLFIASSEDPETNSIVNDMRLPGGEAVFDRMKRIHMPRAPHP